MDLFTACTVPATLAALMTASPRRCDRHRRLPDRHHGVRHSRRLSPRRLDGSVFPREQVAGMVHRRRRGLHLEHLDDPPGRARRRRSPIRHGDRQLRVDGVLHAHPAGPRLRAVLHPVGRAHAARVHGAPLLPGGADVPGVHRARRSPAHPHRHQPVCSCQDLRELSRRADGRDNRRAVALHGDLHGARRAESGGHDRERAGAAAAGRRRAGHRPRAARATGRRRARRRLVSALRWRRASSTCCSLS